MSQHISSKNQNEGSSKLSLVSSLESLSTYQTRFWKMVRSLRRSKKLWVGMNAFTSTLTLGAVIQHVSWTQYGFLFLGTSAIMYFLTTLALLLAVWPERTNGEQSTTSSP